MSDVAPTSSSSADKGPPRSGRRILSAFLLPLFFVIAFPLLFVSALHSPAPNDLPLLVVGPNQVVADIATGLDQTKEFSATHTDVVAEARESVENRIVDGAIEVTVIPADDPAVAPAFEVTTYVANAEGRAVASTVEVVGGDIATQLGASQEVVDVAPLAATDQLGTTLFYLLTYTSLGAYLVIIVLTQVMPGAGLRVRYLAVGCAAVIAPLLVFGLSSIWVGDYGASFATIVALLGVNMLYVFTVGAAAILIQQFLGAAATFGVMAFIVLLNFPSAGGAGPASMLPSFWQFIHSFYFGAGAFESMRSIVYFDGNGTGRWLLQLCLWSAGLVLATLVVHLAKTTRRQKAEITALRSSLAATHQDNDHEPQLQQPQRRRHAQGEALTPDQDDEEPDRDTTERTALTTGQGASR
jgi:hypothetical protein